MTTRDGVGFHKNGLAEFDAVCFFCLLHYCNDADPAVPASHAGAAAGPPHFRRAGNRAAGWGRAGAGVGDVTAAQGRMRGQIRRTHALVRQWWKIAH